MRTRHIRFLAPRLAPCSRTKLETEIRAKSLGSAERANRTVFPPQDETFTALRLCPFDKVRVVIVGQDPYHGPGQAHGLSFSVKHGIQIPPSLLNMSCPFYHCASSLTPSMLAGALREAPPDARSGRFRRYKELEQDPEVSFKRPGHGCLTKWAEQGVLMLNACLSVRKGEANSHQGRGWEQLTDAIISELNKHHSGLVFLLWGKPAEKKCGAVDARRHHVLKAPHPSPLSASRGFFGCRHFSKASACPLPPVHNGHVSSRDAPPACPRPSRCGCVASSRAGCARRPRCNCTQGR